MGHEICWTCNTIPCKCPRDDNKFVVGHGTPLHPSPHAARDKTEEFDIRKGIAANHRGESDVRMVPRRTPLIPPNHKEEDNDPLPPHKHVNIPTPISVKNTNPKDAVGIKKWRQYCTIPTPILWELGVAMLEGARKYGRHNYRISGVRASVYIDAAKGHIDQWWEGEDIDNESKLSHITKAIASLVVLRDAMIFKRWTDDRPPKVPLDEIRTDLQAAVESIFERIPEAKDAYIEGDQYEV